MKITLSVAATIIGFIASMIIFHAGIAKAKPGYEWPNTAAPDKTDKDWALYNSMGVNGTQYLKVEVSPGKWQWKVDEKAMQWLADTNNYRRQLWVALRSRVLTAAEMEEVAGYGTMLNVEPMESYDAKQKTAELNAAMATQLVLQVPEFGKLNCANPAPSRCSNTASRMPYSK